MAQIGAYTITVIGTAGNTITDDRLLGRDIGFITIDGMIFSDYTKNRVDDFLTLSDTSLGGGETIKINLA